MPTLRQLADYALPVAGSLFSGINNRRAAGSATRNLTSGVRNAQDIIRSGADSSRRTMADVYGQQRRTLEPFRAAGAPALDALKTGTESGGEFNKPFTMADFELYKDPGFQFRLDQGLRALKAEANAAGNRFSGATLKAVQGYGQDMASQEAQAAYNRYQGDLSGRFGRLTDVSGIGERAAGQEVEAGGQYGANLARLDQSTAAQLADLETDLASAQAAGDVAKANTITDMISGILSGVEGVSTARTLGSLIPGAAGAAGTAAGTVASTLAPEVAGLAGMAPTAAQWSAATAGIPGAGGGLGSSLAAFATNPITLAAAGALGVGLLWRKSQAHHEANQWVQGTQNEFDRNMARINEATDLDPAAKSELKKMNVIDYMAAALDFKKKGSDQRKVIRQAMDTFRKWYPEFSSMAVS